MSIVSFLHCCFKFFKSSLRHFLQINFQVVPGPLKLFDAMFVVILYLLERFSRFSISSLESFLGLSLCLGKTLFELFPLLDDLRVELFARVRFFQALAFVRHLPLKSESNLSIIVNKGLN